MSNVLKAVNGVMKSIGPVTKSGSNDFHKYNYAKASDVVALVQPLMAEHGLIIIQSEVERTLIAEESAMQIVYDFQLYHVDDEDSETVFARHTGLSSCRARNGAFDDKAANKCHTAARKYFLMALFQIVTKEMDDQDADGQEDAAPGVNISPRTGVSRGRAGKVGNDVIAAPVASKPPSPTPTVPVAISAAGKNEVSWASEFVQLIQAATDINFLTEAVVLNGKVLERVKEKAPELYRNICDRVHEKERDFGISQSVGSLLCKMRSVTAKRALQNVWQNEIDNSSFSQPETDLLSTSFAANEARLSGGAASNAG